MKTLTVKLFLVGLVLCFALPCYGMGTRPPSPPALSSQLLAKAEVDECFNGIGESYKAGPECSRGEDPKANQSYLWGLTKAGDNLWFGTAPNMLCLVRAYSSYEEGYEVNAYQNNLWACEYDEGQYVKTQMSIPVPDVFSDYRPPRIYTYNITTRALTEKSREITNPQARLLLQATFGLRSAVTFGNMVILSGPMALGAGINMFIFNAATGTLMGATTLPQYQNIRKWLVLDNVLYAAVADENGGGKVLRWTGTPTAPFSFTEVGVLDGSGAEIVAHNGRIFVGTWPSRTGEDTTSMAGIWMSPVVPAGGLTTADAGSWKKVWQVDRYEPDPLNAAIYGMGAMESFGGYLYWGTMHVHGKAALIFIDKYNIRESGYADAYFNSWRATAVFRGRNFETSSPSIELLYGDSSLPVYVPGGFWGGYWTSRRNNMGGVSGRYGSSGFGNIYNNYTWTMAVYKDQLFVGTMDHSYLWLDWDNLQFEYLGGQYIYIPSFWSPDSNEFGADLWRFPSTSSAAVRVSRNGLGNYTNYGFRSIVADDATGLYLGTANPANLAQWDDGSIKGGWELIKVYEP